MSMEQLTFDLKRLQLFEACAAPGERSGTLVVADRVPRLVVVYSPGLSRVLSKIVSLFSSTS